jgi:hypothetical protein
VKILRPVFSWGEAAWAHIDHEGVPLCGADEGPDVDLRLEVVVAENEDAVRLCPTCKHVRAGFRVKAVKGGERDANGDRQYVYEVSYVEGPHPHDGAEVLAYCRNHVKQSYRPSEMPSWSSPELLFFRYDPESEVWIYHVQEASTT